jgi:hypothetical protein
MPVIPATWEADIEGWQFEASVDKKVGDTLDQQNKLGMVGHAYNSSYTRGKRYDDHGPRPATFL